MSVWVRIVVACALGYVAVCGVPSLPLQPVSPAASVEVETPGADMQAIVEPVARSIRILPAGDRLLWAHVWSKAAVVVEGDAVATEVAFTDTRSLRAFTTLALDIAWRRIGENVPGSNEALRTATEAAYVKALGAATVPVTADVRKAYAEFARAMAWAGMNRG
ncbi:MAG: hypothetical protein EBR82_87850 [Caulobacteraceae bacterium]|nr:hypothetical protein [Caulobacteraceae bacterium]